MNMKLFSNSRVIGILVFVASITFSTAASAEFFLSTVLSIVPRAESNGDVVIQITPAAGETGFTQKSRVVIDGTSPGANKLVAMFTTALVLGNNISVQVDDPPTFNNIQVVQAAGLRSE